MVFNQSVLTINGQQTFKVPFLNVNIILIGIPYWEIIYVCMYTELEV